jgi:Cdc6-like AAA superfamily ATPase
MAEALADQIIQKIKQTSELYYRLILVVALSGTGKTSALRDVKDRINTPIVNVNLEISRQMLNLTERQRVLQVSQILGKIVNEAGGEIILLDNMEILFDVSLKQDPLRLLQGLSRNKTIVATWNGSIDASYLIYAAPDHPEYRRYPVVDFCVVSPEVTT